VLTGNPSSRHHESQYGEFTLTRAIRPSDDLVVVPRAGFRQTVFRDPKRKFKMPMLCASVSSELLFETFLALLEPLGPVVHVILETSHERTDGSHRDLLREGIDLPVLQSYCCDHEDMLLHDGCCGIAVMNESRTMEVQFDEHKILTVYAKELKPFRRILKRQGLQRDDTLQLLTEAEHTHVSHPEFVGEFEQLCYRLGIGEAVEHVNWE
jgi:hypothetical protein